ncbi:hypothetical protein N9046_08635 [Akkermansiaceae bacterium]|nr:hypothetical protein [Akkermansiaceae bacterium]
MIYFIYVICILVIPFVCYFFAYELTEFSRRKKPKRYGQGDAWWESWPLLLVLPPVGCFVIGVEELSEGLEGLALTLARGAEYAFFVLMVFSYHKAFFRRVTSQQKKREQQGD